MRRPEGLSERSTRWSSRGEHFWFEPEGLQAADFFARSELAPESGKDKERLLGRNGREEFGVEGFDTLIENRARGPRYYQRPTLSGDQRIFSDLAAYAPGMTSSIADTRAVLEAEAAPRSGLRKGSIDPAARRRIDSAAPPNGAASFARMTVTSVHFPT